MCLFYVRLDWIWSVGWSITLVSLSVVVKHSILFVNVFVGSEWFTTYIRCHLFSSSHFLHLRLNSTIPRHMHMPGSSLLHPQKHLSVISLIRSRMHAVSWSSLDFLFYSLIYVCQLDCWTDACMEPTNLIAPEENWHNRPITSTAINHPWCRFRWLHKSKGVWFYTKINKF